MKILRSQAYLCALGLMMVLVSADAVSAQLVAQADTANALTDFASESLWSSVGRLAIALIVVVVLIWGTLWVAKRVMSGRLMGHSDSPVRILERCHLAPKRSVDVVSIGNRVLVLGVTEHNIGLLTELQPGDLPASSAFADALNQKQTTDTRYRDALSQARQKLNELFQSARDSEKEPVPTSR
ncbi:MAG: flagellar biosynthetic protein FliO [candidate division Zixibacteria bacterium]|nr:flagellar biosynthetic protein FliO [candidate division Zixibacteria bacterium]